jgi:hypothetical protein
VAAGKPSESKKPYKIFGGNRDMAFMQSMSKAYAKDNKKAGKSKKCKKHDNDSSDSSDSEWETGYSNTGFSADKRLKLDEPLSTVYLSTELRPIKVVDTAPSENIRANKFVIKTAKISKVTAVVAVMSIYCKKDAIHKALIPGMRSLLAKRQKVPISWSKIPADRETFL